MKMQRESIPRVSREIIECERCARYVKRRKNVAREKSARFIDREYWGKPVSGFGDPKARLLFDDIFRRAKILINHQ